MDKPFEESEFTFFDTETTGLEPQAGDRIIELAAIRLSGGRQTARFHALINPHRPVSEGAFRVNRITPEMLADAKEAKAVIPQFLHFISGSCLCSYNAPFDMSFLESELERLGLRLPDSLAVADVLRMARRLLPGLERYALWFVAERLGIQARQEHRALSDVELTIEVFQRLGAILKQKHPFNLGHFLSLFGLDSALLQDIQNQKLATIQEALDKGARIKISYLASANAEVTEREVLPRQIHQENRRSYLIGYCCLRKEERSFRVDSILHIELV